MVLGTLSMLHSRKVKANKPAMKRSRSRTTSTSTSNFTPRVQAALAREIARRESAIYTYASAFEHQSRVVNKHKPSGCPYLSRTSSMTSSTVSPNTPPSRASPPRSPKFIEVFDDELAASEQDLLDRQAIPLRPLPSSATMTSSYSPTSHSNTTSPGPRRSRSQSRRSERARSESITLVPSDTHDASMEILGSAIESALKLNVEPLTSRRRTESVPLDELQAADPFVSPRRQSHHDKPLPDIHLTQPLNIRPAENSSDAVQTERVSYLPRSISRVPVSPPVYDPFELDAYQWIAPLVTTSRPPNAWGWSKRWKCCRCEDGKTIVEQQICSNLECQHVRCRTACRVSKA